MRIIKIYDHLFAPLTEFLDGEFEQLEYSNKLDEVGSCQFLLKNSNSKTTVTNIQHYNRIEIIEDGVIEWVGYIASKNINIDTVQIRGLQLYNLLKKRMYTGHLTGNAGDAIVTVLASANAVEDTGIVAGDISLSSTIDLTFTNQDAYSVIKSIAEKATAQTVVDTSRALNAKTTLGSDLSASVNVLFNTEQPEQATLLNFEVSDDGSNIVTQAIGVSGSFTGVKDDLALQAVYGILQSYFNIAVANDQPNTDALTQAQLKDANYSPRLDLNPLKVNTAFDVGDLVHVDIRSDLVSITGNYQVLQKSVKIQGTQKLISITTNNLKSDFITEVRNLQKRLQLLETN